MFNPNRRRFNALLSGSILAGATSGVPAFAQDAEPRPDLFLGDETASVTVIEYASLTCPHCATFHKNVYPSLKENFIDTGKIKFVMREVYFDKYGLWAGMLARCGAPERYFPFIDLLFKTQSEWLRAGEENDIVAALFKLGRQTGLSDDEMGACLQDGDLAKALVADYQLKAGEDNVRSTPSFVIDGELQANMTYTEFEELLNDKLGE